MGAVTVKVPVELDRWVAGLNRIEADARREAEKELAAASKFMFDKSQEVVHVITGALKRSGSYSVEQNSEGVLAVLSYGNDEVDYASYEMARGGSHDFMGRAWEASEEKFAGVLDRVMESVVDGWR